MSVPNHINPCESVGQLCSTPAGSAFGVRDASAGNLSAYLFSNPLQHAPNPDPALYPHRSFEGKPIPPSRPFLIQYHAQDDEDFREARPSAILTWEQARQDVARIAAFFDRRYHVPPSNESPSTGEGSKALFLRKATVLLHLPNCFSFPVLLLGATAAKWTASPVSVALQVPELAAVLSKLRPNVIVTSTAFETRMRDAVAHILSSAPSSSSEFKWADRFMQGTWPTNNKNSNESDRLFLVYLPTAADRYRVDKSDRGPIFQSPKDWNRMLQVNPQSSGFKIEPMQPTELKQRVALILWSSGTTGASKGVLLSHAAAMASAPCIWYGCAYRAASETWISLAPWFHTYGLHTMLLPALAIGATVVIPPASPDTSATTNGSPAPPPFNLKKYIRMLAMYRATYAHIAPPVAVGIATAPFLSASHPLPLPHLQGFLTGGAPIPAAIAKAVFSRTGGKYLFNGYGGTEACAIAHTVGLVPYPTCKTPSELAELGSVGFPMPNVHVRIAPPTSQADAKADRDQATVQRTQEYRRNAANLLANGEAAARLSEGALVGEIQIRSPTCFLGYLDPDYEDSNGNPVDQALTAPCFTSDGFFRTGDEGVLDTQSNLWITGRIKELIKVKGGFQCSPSEVEACFADHPMIVDSACCGLYDSAQAAEWPILFVVPKQKQGILTEAELETWRVALTEELAGWAAFRLSHYKQPRFYAFVPAIIKNPTGKILRKDLLSMEVKKYSPKPRRVGLKSKL